MNQNTLFPSTAVRTAFLDAAAAATALLADPAVRDRWTEPSALPRYTVAGLAGHLAGQVFFVRDALGQPAATAPTISLMDYYRQVPWLTASHDADPHVRIRTGSEEIAECGAAELADRAANATRQLQQGLPDTPPRPFRLDGWGDWSVWFDDFVATRTMELAVHIDDLAASVDIESAVPPAAADVALTLLLKLSVLRHGSIAVLRGLSRDERAPASLSAL